jgi:arylsulfatase A-like enzyme
MSVQSRRAFSCAFKQVVCYVPSRNLICIVVDRIHAGMVGAYGNSWIRTRRLDQLACESFLFDQAVASSPNITELYRGYWFGSALLGAAEVGSSLPQLVGAAGMHTALVTDDALVASLATAGHFSERVLIESPAQGVSATETADAQMARLLAAATRWIETAPQPFCLWIHARGMSGDWDAPLEFRDRFADEDDPQPPRFVTPPDRLLSDDYDPDELLGIVHAYAGQISLVDLCLGDFCDAIEHSDLAANTQLTLLSARGFPMGEHKRVGPCDEPLYNELVQIPWLMRFPDGLGKLCRSQALVLPQDLPGTLLDWLDIDRGLLGAGHATSLLDIVRGERELLRDRALLISRRDRAIRTPGWYLRRPDSGPAELYAKPGDRWEVNEVAKLLPEVTAGLQDALTELEQSGEATLPPLPDLLVSVMD